jgi:hypothetical protein
MMFTGNRSIRSAAWRRGGAALLGLVLMLLAQGGCATREALDVTYGRTGGTPGGKSVNGLSVLMEMFKAAGNNVTTTTRFSPRLNKADTIVWAPDDFSPPSLEHREYLEQWLAEGYGRTVIYIGRDYDAAIEYWTKAAPLAPPNQAAEYQRNLAEAVSRFGRERMQLPPDTYARWFMLKSGGQRHKVTTLSGPWADGIDSQKCEIELAAEFAIPTQADVPPTDYQQLPHFETLLSSQGEQLATRVTYDTWSEGQIIVIPNGSYLLNLPLVNQEHRKLAGKLIDECAYDANVVFIESGPGGPPIRQSEDETGKTGFEMLSVYPLGPILLHGIFWLFVVSLCLYPIFGRPRKYYGVATTEQLEGTTGMFAKLLLGSSGAARRRDASASTGDFGRHLDALGELFSLTGDRAFAIQKLTYYQNHVRRDSGASHVDQKKPPPTPPPTAPPAETTAPTPPALDPTPPPAANESLTANSLIRRDN